MLGLSDSGILMLFLFLFIFFPPIFPGMSIILNDYHNVHGLVCSWSSNVDLELVERSLCGHAQSVGSVGPCALASRR